MENTAQINKGVNVVAFYFKNAGGRLDCFPRKIEFDGQRVEFKNDKMVKAVQKGQRLVQLFGMSDGAKEYELEFDDQTSDWTLVSVAMAS